jgi:hypothetical protein
MRSQRTLTQFNASSAFDIGNKVEKMRRKGDVDNLLVPRSVQMSP